MDVTEKEDAARKIHEKARYFRGRFLNYVAVIDRDISHILTEYFSSQDQDKKELFYNEILTGYFFTLSNKKDVLIKVVKKDYPNYWETNREILKDLDDIIQFRNKLAHSIVDVSEEALARPIEKGIGFVDWKAGEPITDKQFNLWEVKCNMVSSCLCDVKRLLPYKENPDYRYPA